MSHLPEIEGYQLTEQIGSGGIASVYRGVDQNQRAIALKLLSSTETAEIEFFKNEFLLLNQINHPDVVKVFDFGISNKGNAFFSMEIVEGKDFREYSRELDSPQFYSLVIRTLGVLEFLHTKRIIHADIKPSNILISSDADGKPVPKFTDFGFAECGKDVEQQLWKGTIPYLAPEIIRGEEYNHQVDLYSFGVMLYEVLTGKLPFEDSDAMRMAREHLEREPEFPNDTRLPEFLKRLTLRLLKKDPLDRYYSAREVIEDLVRGSGIKDDQAELTVGMSLISSSDLSSRKEELSFLRGLFEKAKCGHREMILLKSEKGAGKTRLLKELKSYVQTYGATVIWKNIQESAGTSLAELDNISPRSYPAVLIFDDFQKIGLEILNSLVTAINQTKIDKMMICFSSDNNKTLSEEDKKAQQIEKILENGLKGVLTKTVLEPLGQKETFETINSMFRWKVDEEKINETIYKKSGGNPLLITGLMSSLLQKSSIRKAGPGWELDPVCINTINAPEGYIEEVRERLSMLSSESLRIVRIASVLGQEFESDILSDLSGLNENDTEDHLAPMSMENLVRKSQSSDKGYAFINGMVRDVIYYDIDESKRKELHCKCGEILEAIYASNPESVINTLAYHFVHAGKRESAFKYSLMAGRKSEQENKQAHAIEHYENVLRFYEEGLNEPFIPKDEILTRIGKQHAILGNSDKALDYYSRAIEAGREENQVPDRIAKLYQEVGVLYLRKGEYEDAIKVLSDGLSMCRGIECTKVSAELNVTLGWVYQKKSDPTQAISCFQESIRLLSNETSRELGLALNGLGVVHWGLGELSKALNCYQKSLKVFEELKDESRIATVNINLGLLLRSKGEPKEALRYFEKALQSKQKSGTLIDLSFLYNDMGLTWENLYEWDKSLESHQKSYEIKNKMRDQNGLAVALTNMGIVHLKRGTLGKSVENLTKALRLFESQQDKLGVAHVCLNLGEAYLFREEWPKSRSFLERALRLFREVDDKSGLGDSLRLSGRLNLEAGDFATANSQLKESLKIFDILGNKNKILQTLLVLTELSLRQNNMTEAEINLSYGDRLLNLVDDQAMKGKLKRVRAILFRKKGNLEKSLREFLEAERVFRELKLRYDRGMTCLEIGKIKSERKRFREATVYLKDALAIFKEAEILPKVLECETLLKDSSALIQMDYQRTQVLYQVSELLARITERDELLTKILDLAIEHLSAERAAVILYDPVNDSLELKAAQGIELETKSDAVSISQRVIRNVLRKDEPLIVEDASSDPETSSYKSVITYNILSILCVPLVIGNKVLGTIYVDHRSLSGIFSKEDLDFLKAFANLVAVALEKAKLYGELYEEIFQLKKDLSRTYSYPNIVGRSKKMQEVFQMVEKVASTKTSILLVGESGTGKELIANLIHYTGVRKDRPFVKINCAALPESILESELFGVEDRVATGVAMRDGKFKQGDGGTIFFDEIGDMSLSTQAKVLRVLQEREFERVGGSKTISVDIRVISATNKDLEDCIKKGFFRRDLFFRLNPVTIKIPALRERKEDVPYLIEHFLVKFSQENKKPKPAIPVKVMDVLIDYAWPGNVRELANFVERIVLFSENGSFPKELLPTAAQVKRGIKLLSPEEGLAKILDRVEKEVLLQALEQNSWNQVKAASQLGISEATLRRKMSNHKLQRLRRDARQK